MLAKVGSVAKARSQLQCSRFCMDEVAACLKTAQSNMITLHHHMFIRMPPTGIKSHKNATDNSTHGGNALPPWQLLGSNRRHSGPAAQKGYALSVANDGPALPEGFDPAACKRLGMGIIRSLVERISDELRIGRGDMSQGTRFTVLFSWLSTNRVPIDFDDRLTCDAVSGIRSKRERSPAR